MTSDPQRFSLLALLYLVTNARIGSGDKRRRVQRVMTRPEREAVTAVLEGLPTTVASWSDGLATLEPMHIVEVHGQLRSLSSAGDGIWWAGPRDCRQELADYAAEPAYDGVFVLWPSAPDVQLCGWGCTVAASDVTQGAAFTSIASDHWPTLATDPDPAQGYVHEWLHQVEAEYRGLGLDRDVLPELHEAASYTSMRPATEPPFGRSYADYHDGAPADSAAGPPALPPARTWSPWYRDWMTGRLRPIASGAPRESGPAIGLTPDRWALRSR